MPKRARTATADNRFPTTETDAFGEIVKRCLWKPELFVYEVLRADPDPWQVEAMRGLIEKKAAAISGCNGAGKDALGAWMALWVLCTRPYAKGQITAPNKDQLFAVFWAGEYCLCNDILIFCPIVYVATKTIGEEAWTPVRNARIHT
jgi:hypothetical protein